MMCGSSYDSLLPVGNMFIFLYAPAVVGCLAICIDFSSTQTAFGLKLNYLV